MSSTSDKPSKNTAVFGIYATAGTAEAAVDHLLSKGFSNSSISVLLPDDDSTRAFAHEKNTKTPEGTTTGGIVGGLIGGSLGLVIGLGALVLPGVGPLLAAGPIIGALTGVGAGGVVGGIVGALVGMGIPEYEAKRYEGAVKGGGILLSVHCDTSEEVAIAKQALADTGARDIAATGEVGAGRHPDREDHAQLSDSELRERERIDRDREREEAGRTYTSVRSRRTAVEDDRPITPDSARRP